MFSSLPIWIVWMIICGFCFVVEIFTVSFMMLWPGIAALFVAIISFFNVPIQIQISIFAIISILLLVFTKPLTKKIFKSSTVTTNVNSVIGKQGVVIEDVNNLNGKGKVKVGSETWSAITNENETIKKGSNIVSVGIDGVKLIVKKVD